MKPWSEVPTGWEETTLDELGAEVRSGFASGKHNQEGRGIPHLRPMNVSRSGEIDLADVKYVEPSDDRRLMPGDVLFNNTNSPALVGKTAHFTRAGEYAFSNHMTRVRPPAKLDSRFLAHQLHYLWMSGYFQMICRNHVNQASVASHTLARDVPVLVAPLDEQQRIVQTIEEQFSRLDAGVESLRRAKRSLPRMRASVLKAATDGGFVESSGGSWETATIRDIAVRLDYGSSAKASLDSEGVPMLRMGNIQDGRITLDDMKFLPFDHPDTKKLSLSSGDVLFNRTNSAELVGKSAVVTDLHEGMTFASYLIRLRFESSVIPQFVAHVLNGPLGREYIAKVRSQQVGQANVNGTKLAAFALPLPPVEQQREIVAEVDRQLSLIDAIETVLSLSLVRASLLRESVLGQAFAGRLTRSGAIPDA